MKRTRTVAVFLTVLVLAGACGSNDDTGSTTVAPPVDTTANSPTTSAAPTDDAGEDRSAELLGRWEITLYRLPNDGAITNVVGANPVFIEFAADGTVAYHTGCNSGGTEFTTSGTYQVPTSALDDTPEGQAITLGPAFEQTEIGCEGFLGEQDVDLPANMAAATRFTMDDDRLILADEFLLIEATRAG